MLVLAAGLALPPTDVIATTSTMRTAMAAPMISSVLRTRYGLRGVGWTSDGGGVTSVGMRVSFVGV